MLYTEDLCVGGTPLADSVYGGDMYPASNAFNDDANSTWWMSADTFPHWVGYQFANAQTIIRLRIFQHAYWCASFSIEGSNGQDADWDDKSWTTLRDVTGAGDLVWETYDFSNSVAYEFVRIRATSGSGHASRWAVCEIELMAEDQGEVSDGAALGDSVEAMNLSDSISDGAALGDSVEVTSLTDGISDGASLGDSVSSTTEFSTTISDGSALGDSVEAVNLTGRLSDGADLGDSVSRHIERDKSVSDGASLGDSVECFNWTEWLEQNIERAVPRYCFTLTGDSDATTDAEIPISSWQARHRSGDPSYLSVSIPYTATRASQINARPNGEMVVELAYLLDGEESVREEIIRADLEDIYIYEGARSKSIVLVGHKTITFSSKIVTLTGVSYKETKNGVLRYRADPDLYLKPGDTVKYDGDEITAGLVTYYVGETFATMEVEESA